jgi:hypothetical protein
LLFLGREGPMTAVSVALATAALYAAGIPLTATNLVTGPQSHLELTNTAAQPVTAWSLAIVTHNGPRTRREVETVDGYLTEATHGLRGSSERLERLMPGQSRVIALDPLPDDASAEVIAAVLEDGTAYGDEQQIASIFAARVKQRDALGAVVAAFDDALKSKHGTDALDALRVSLGNVSAREESIPCRAAIDAVESYRQKSSADDIDRSLRNYRDLVAREYGLAEQAAVRRE